MRGRLNSISAIARPDRARALPTACAGQPRAGRAARVAGALLLLVLCPWLAGASAAQAVDQPRPHPALPPGLPRLPTIGQRMSTDDLSGFAMRGFDPVAYFALGIAKAGSAEYEYGWAGAIWRFSSAANRAAFMAEPQVYAPVFDGYDAVAIAEGRIVESDPLTFAILDNRLFFFRTAATRDAFLADDTLMKRSFKAWPNTLRQLSR